MKKLKKIVCLLLTSALVFGCMNPLTLQRAEAKAAKTGKLSISGTQNYKEAQQLLKLINKQRKKNRLSSLKLDKSLTSSAITRAAELAIRIPWSGPHKRPNGKLSKSINSRISYEDCAESTGFYYGPKDIFDMWMDSPPHKAGILRSTAKCVGIGCVTVSPENRFWVLDFSDTKAKSVQKSTKTTSFSKSITVLSTYLKKSHFKISTYSKTFYVGEKRQVHVEYDNDYSPSYINPSSFKWTSSNPSVASVSSKGVVKAKKAGTVKITAKLKTGTKVSFSIKASVKKKV